MPQAAPCLLPPSITTPPLPRDNRPLDDFYLQEGTRMHTQNVNINTATRKTPERCDQLIISSIIAEQKSLIFRLAGVWVLQLPPEEEEEEISMLVLQLAENVLLYGVTDWSRKKPMILWGVACFWIQAYGLWNMHGAIWPTG